MVLSRGRRRGEWAALSRCNGHPGIAMLLDGTPADDEVGNVMDGQGGDGGLGGLHKPGGSGILAQNISRLVCHASESRISPGPVQSVSARRTAVRHPVTPAHARMGSILIASDLLLMNV